MRINRRIFLKSTGLLGAGGLLAELFGLDVSGSVEAAKKATARRGRVTSTICPYCGVGCGALVTALDGKIINVEGDPEHPINEGALCSKGSALLQVAVNERRAQKVLYRAPGGTAWEEKTWDWAIERIAEKIKHTRDTTFETKDAEGRVVNRTQAIACMGGAALDNEECYAYSKFARSLGSVFIEHQARI